MWIRLIWLRIGDQWRALMNTIINLRVLQSSGKFLSSCTTGGSSGIARLREFSYEPSIVWPSNKDGLTQYGALNSITDLWTCLWNTQCFAMMRGCVLMYSNANTMALRAVYFPLSPKANHATDTEWQANSTGTYCALSDVVKCTSSWLHFPPISYP
jgi:hypothetical protein